MAQLNQLLTKTSAHPFDCHKKTRKISEFYFSPFPQFSQRPNRVNKFHRLNNGGKVITIFFFLKEKKKKTIRLTKTKRKNSTNTQFEYHIFPCKNNVTPEKQIDWRTQENIPKYLFYANGSLTIDQKAPEIQRETEDTEENKDFSWVYPKTPPQ